MGLPAAGAPIVKDDGAGDVLRQYPFDLPHQLLAFLPVALDRLLLDQPVYFRIAVTVIILLGTAPVAPVEVLVWVGPAARLLGGDNVVLAHTLGQPAAALNRFQLAINVHLLQLVDQDHRRIAKDRDVARRYLNVQRLTGPVTELLHDAAGFPAVFLDIGTIAGESAQDFRGHSP